MKRTAFDLFHPVVALACFVFLLVMDMAAMQPIYLLISFGGALIYNIILRGIRNVARMLAWLIPFVLVVALVNFAFSAVGSIEVGRIGSHVFYLESLIFGLCMGLIFASAILTFSNAAQVLTSDKIMALLGNIIPNVSLMVCMIARLVPRFVRQGGDIGGVRRACTSAQSLTRTSSLRAWAREISVLMGWSMENSLETADSMRARGWGSTVHRSTYTRYRLRFDDIWALIFLAVLMVSSAVSAYVACSQFQFYPQMTGFAPWWSYIAYVIFVMLPIIAHVWEWLRWHN